MRVSASYTVGVCPLSDMKRAALKPAGPPPIIAMFRCFCPGFTTNSLIDFREKYVPD